jgi:hypothetical protein
MLQAHSCILKFRIDRGESQPPVVIKARDHFPSPYERSPYHGRSPYIPVQASSPCRAGILPATYPATTNGRPTIPFNPQAHARLVPSETTNGAPPTKQKPPGPIADVRSTSSNQPGGVTAKARGGCAGANSVA